MHVDNVFNIDNNYCTELEVKKISASSEKSVKPQQVKDLCECSCLNNYKPDYTSMYF